MGVESTPSALPPPLCRAPSLPWKTWKMRYAWGQGKAKEQAQRKEPLRPSSLGSYPMISFLVKMLGF